jgi:hypothetical protein
MEAEQQLNAAFMPQLVFGALTEAPHRSNSDWQFWELR